MPSQILILTGMHRSGTSLLASILQSAGVQMGKELLPADQRNRHGFFEDLGFYGFHQQALFNRGKTPYVGPEFSFEPTAEETEKAHALIREREGQHLWGWKDPRTCLFLDFWRDLLPEARFFFVYRHPLDVLGSLLRRGEAHTPGILEALVAWDAYDARIRAFCRRHPSSTLLCHAYTAVGRPEEVARLLKTKLGVTVSLDRSTVEGRYHPAELQRLPLTNTIHEFLRAVHPDSAGLYDELESLADLAGGPIGPGEPTAPGLEATREIIRAFGAPHPPSRKRALLLLLMGALEPELVEAYFRGLTSYVQKLELEHGARAAWLEAVEADNRVKQQFIEKQEAHVSSQKSWIGSLEADNRAKQEFIEKQEATVGSQRRWIATLESEVTPLRERIQGLETTLRGIHESRSWRWAQRLAALHPARLRARLQARGE